VRAKLFGGCGLVLAVLSSNAETLDALVAQFNLTA
jgi:hypothetical protein